MEFLVELWLPILLSTLLVFVVSAIIHMVLPIHKKDCQKLPNEEKLLGELRKQGVRPGEYMFPCAGSMKEMCTPEMTEKYKQGPVGFMTIKPPGPCDMGRSLFLWFLYIVVIGIFTGYVSWLGLGRGAEYLTVFRVTGAVAILGYALSQVPNAIWKGQNWFITFKLIFDGVVYGLVTAGTFGWLWPRSL